MGHTLTLERGILGNMTFLDFVGPSSVRSSRQNDKRQKELLNKTKVKNTKLKKFEDVDVSLQPSA